MKGKSSENIQKKLLKKINEAADVISKSTSTPANWVVYSGADLPAFYDKRRIIFVKQWLHKKKIKEGRFDLHSYYSIGTEDELTKMLTEELAKEIKKEYAKLKSTQINSF